MGHSVSSDIQLNVRCVSALDQLPKNISKCTMDKRFATGELDQLYAFGMLGNLFKDDLLPSVNRRSVLPAEPCRMDLVRSNSRTEHRRTHPAFQVAVIAEPKMQRRRERHFAATVETALRLFQKLVVSRDVQSPGERGVHTLT